MNLNSLMETLKNYLHGHLNRTLSPRATVAIISIISLVASFADFVTSQMVPEDACQSCRSNNILRLRANIYCLRSLLLKLFQVANLILLLGCIIENSIMMQLYIWYTLSFVVFGFVVTLVEFLSRIKREQVWTFMALFADVLYLFVIFWCLPIIDTYRKSLKGDPLVRNSAEDVV
ncbi:PREDICTED: uncharacterized protein LOC106106577 [Papilio polytes]|uniref:uncharacterized protein LOC106106577 n=1 Tax=Papilio polytes TaxID=76194 RepID=UPI0006760112|nr:PREDICTED: uncharacterized protein LOC106106577 [Papilio polytes]